MSKLECNVCQHHCKLSENQIGLCKAGINTGEKIASADYAKITSIALDPIENKHL